MNILEVESVCSIFWDVLDVAIDIVYGLSSIRVVLAEFLTIDHLEVGFD